MEVRADHVGQKTQFDRPFRDPVMKAPGAVTQIEEHAALSCVVNLRDHPVVAAEDMIPLTLIAMGHDIARAKQFENTRQGDTLVDMDHDPGVHHLGGFDGPPERFHAVASHLEDPLPDLHADAMLRPHRDNPGRVLGIGVFDVLHFAAHGVQESDTADMDESEHFGPGRFNDVLEKTAQVGPSRAPGVYDGRYPGGQAEGVGLDAEGRGAGVDVGVQVDPARRQVFARYVDGPMDAGFETIGNRGDFAVSDPDVAFFVLLLGRIDDRRPRQHQIESHEILRELAQINP